MMFLFYFYNFIGFRIKQNVYINCSGKHVGINIVAVNCCCSKVEIRRRWCSIYIYIIYIYIYIYIYLYIYIYIYIYNISMN